MSENLKTITIEEIEQKIHDHQLWLKGDSEDKRADFSGYDFNELIESINNQKISNDLKNILSKRAYSVFSGKNLSNSIFEGSNLTSFMFLGTNLKNANFQNTNLSGCLFQDANLSLADFRNATSFDFSRFNENQIRDAIFTSKEYEEKTSKKLKTQEKIIDNTNEEQTDLLIEGFENIKNDFELEERRWLIISIFSFLILITLTIISIIDYIAPGNTIKYLMYLLISGVGFILLILYAITEENKKISDTTFLKWPSWKNLFITIGKTLLSGYLLLGLLSLNNYINNINTKKDSLFNFENPYYIFIPFSLGLFSFIYFSICQYSKAKELRIENQNKIALLHGFQAINSNELIKNKDIFYANIAHVVFTKAYNSKNNQNLPIDKIIELINISQK